MPSQTDVQRWLDTAEAIVEPDQAQKLSLDGLFGNPGFLTFLGLMQGEKNGLAFQLARTPLSTDGGRWQAAVLQGQIKAIDNLGQTIVSLFPADQA